MPLSSEDRQAIESLVSLYGHAVDEPSLDSIRSVFAEDGVFDATSVGRGRFEGAVAIADFFALGKPPHPPSHHTTNVHVYEEDGVVRVLSKFIVPIEADGTVRTGDYRDVVVHEPVGWRIKERVAIPRYYPAH